MLRGLYTATSGMIAEQRRHDTITHNIANAQTPGYKAQDALSRSFPEVMIHLLRDNEASSSSEIGRMHNGVFVEEIVQKFAQGDLEQTENASDFAIVSNITEIDGQLFEFDASGQAVTEDGETIFQPQAFFTLQNADGELRYTRNGHFMLNEAGALISGNGLAVVDRNGEPIVLGTRDDDTPYAMEQLQLGMGGILIDKMTGEALEDDNGDPLTLGISRIDNPHLLISEGGGAYRLDEEGEAEMLQEFDQVQVLQGYIERSNVDPAQSMVDMMAAARAYEANQKVIQFYDSSLEKAVTEVGKV